MANKESRGMCLFCGTTYAKRGMTKHLTGCKKRQEAIGNAKSGATLYHLLIQDAYSKEYWMHLEMKGTAQLIALDKYLRSIWLECCGHMSQFSIGGWRGDEIPKSSFVQSIFGSSRFRGVATRYGFLYLPTKMPSLLAFH